MELSINTAPLAGAADTAPMACAVHACENGADSDEVIRLHAERHHNPAGWTYQTKALELTGSTFAGDRLRNFGTVIEANGEVLVQSKGDETNGKGLDPTKVTSILSGMVVAEQDYGATFKGFLPGNENDRDRLIGQSVEYWTALGRVATQVERAEYWAPRVAAVYAGMDAAGLTYPKWGGAMSTPTRLEGYMAKLVELEPAAAASIDAVTFHEYNSDPRFLSDFDVVGRCAAALGRTVPVHIGESATDFVTFPPRDDQGRPLYRKPEDRYVTYGLATFIEALRAGITQVHDFTIGDAEFQLTQQTEDQGQGHFRFDGTERESYTAQRIMARITRERAVAHEVTLSETRPYHFHAMGFRAQNSRRGVLLVRCETDAALSATAYRNWHLRNLEPLSSLDPAVEAEAVALEAAMNAATGTLTSVTLTNLGANPVVAERYGAVSKVGTTVELRGNAAALVVER